MIYRLGAVVLAILVCLRPLRCEHKASPCSR